MNMTLDEYNKQLDENMSEEEHQTRLFEELAILTRTNPMFDLPFHIANGGMRHKSTAGRMKAAGVKPGVPDIFVPVASYGYHGLFIELKSLKKGVKLSSAQINKGYKLAEQGYAMVVCNGWRSALKTIIKYLPKKESMVTKVTP